MWAGTQSESFMFHWKLHMERATWSILEMETEHCTLHTGGRKVGLWFWDAEHEIMPADQSTLFHEIEILYKDTQILGINSSCLKGLETINLISVSLYDWYRANPASATQQPQASAPSGVKACRWKHSIFKTPEGHHPFVFRDIRPSIYIYILADATVWKILSRYLLGSVGDRSCPQMVSSLVNWQKSPLFCRIVWPRIGGQ